MDKYHRIPLRTLKHKRIYYNQILINDYLKQIEDLGLEFNNLDFVKMIALTTPKMELTSTTLDAYDYILNNYNINKDSIRKLYGILSRDELDDEELDSMGLYYRNTLEFIQGSSIFSLSKIGPDPEEIEEYMNSFIDFINDYELDDFIKSQIISLYLVYIHPYPNVNGRMARMLGNWYLIKNNRYSYIIFNRIPSYSPSIYTNSIKSIYKHGNITPFLSFVLLEMRRYLERMGKLFKIMELKQITDISTFRILDYLSFLDDSNLKSLVRFNSFQDFYISPSEMLDILSLFLDDDFIVKSDGGYCLSNEKKSYHI